MASFQSRLHAKEDHFDNVTEAILWLRKVFDECWNEIGYGGPLNSQWDLINEGRCDYFASAVEQLVPSCDATWGPGHCFVRCDDRYYDSETPEGVEYPDQLPFFSRYQTYESDWADYLYRTSSAEGNYVPQSLPY